MNNEIAGMCGRSFSPAVKEQTFKDLVAELRTSGPRLRSLRHGVSSPSHYPADAAGFLEHD